MIEWESFTAIRITGNDRVKWLNNLVTNDVRHLASGQGIETFVTDVKGRVLSHGVVLPDNDALVFLSWGGGQGAGLIGHWDRYIIREDVQLTDISSEKRCFFLDRNELAEIHPSQSVEGVAPLVPVSLTGGSATVIRYPGVSDGYWLLAVDRSDHGLKLEANPVSDKTPEGQRTLDRLRLEVGWPIYQIDYDLKNLPQELDRDRNAISFQKGCYLGQETVARLDALGQIQKKWGRLNIAPAADDPIGDSLPHGTKLFHGDQEAGWITSAVRDKHSSDGWLAYGYLRRAYFSVSSPFRLSAHRPPHGESP